MVNPAEPNGLAAMVSDMYERIQRLEGRVAVLERGNGQYYEHAVVTVAGSPQCTVTYGSGTERVLFHATSYTPVNGDDVIILNSPVWCGVLCQASAV